MFPSCYWTAQAEVTVFGVEIWDPDAGAYVPANVTEQCVWQSAGLPVPEPSCAVLLILGVWALRRRRQVPGPARRPVLRTTGAPSTPGAGRPL